MTASIFGDFLNWIKEGIIWVINLTIASIGALISYILGLLPTMPSLPDLPSLVSSAFHFGAYWFPVAFLVDTGTITITLWLAWMVVAIPLRWAKATNQ